MQNIYDPEKDPKINAVDKDGKETPLTEYDAKKKLEELKEEKE